MSGRHRLKARFGVPIIPVWLALLAPTAWAQDPGQGEAAPEAVEEIVEAELESGEEVDDGGWLVTPFVAPSFAPEFGLGLFGGALLSVRTDPDDPDLDRSVLPISIGFSTTGSVQASVYFASYWLGDFIRWNMDTYGGRLPDNYWGVGYEAGRNVEQGESTTSYLRLYWGVEPSLYFQIFGNFFAGLRLDFDQNVAKDLNARMQSDPSVQQYGSDIFSGGAGLAVQYDGRDNIASAYSGVYLFLSGRLYPTWLGSNFAHERIDFTYSQYQTIVRPGSTLAWRVRGCAMYGEVPWTEMCILGGSDNLRGYYTGQYRDKSSLLIDLEYRFMFEHGRVLGFPHGFVVFAGAGSVAPNLAELKHWLPSAGLGYRVEVQPRMNIRIDIAAGLEGSSLYVTFLETF